MFFEIRNTNKGKGLFALKNYNIGDVIMKMDGETIDKQKAEKLEKEHQNNLLQIGNELYLDLRGKNQIFINHSCSPNTCIKIVINNAFLIAIKPISKNDELLFDYSLTSTDTPEEWKMNCACHRFYCRKTISGFLHMSKIKQEEYLKKNIVPKYIVDKIKDK